MRLRDARSVALFSLLCAACAKTGDASRARTGLVVLKPADAPSLEIGVMEGDPNYSLESVASVVHLPSGELAVGDGGSERVTLFSADGKYVRRFAGRGEGPGELRDLGHVHVLAPDTIGVSDGAMKTMLVFDKSGAYRRQFDAYTLSRDSSFTLDSWLHGRFWVEGALSEAERAPVRAALDALPEPAGAPGYRFVRVGEGGSLWIREPQPPGSSTVTWTITDAAGRPTSTVALPARFEPLEPRATEVTGRWLGDSDVNFVRTYALARTNETTSAPSWISSPTAPPAQAAPDEAQFLETIRAAVKKMAVAQEINYAKQRTYTSDVDSLKWERPEGLEVQFVNANSRAWAAVFAHPALNRICVLGYGYDVPAGWSPGRILCSPARASAPPPAAGATGR